MRRAHQPERGFTLVEVLIATTITVIVSILACRLAVEAGRAGRADEARVDLQQRARVAADRIGRALLEAGAGPALGAAKGPLNRFVPAVIARRTGRRNADPPATFRTDAWTMMRVAGDAEAGALGLPVGEGTTALELAAGCQRQSCGFVAGTHVLLVDAAGNSDAFTVLSADDTRLTVRHHGSGNRTLYAAGTVILAVETTTFYLDPEARILRTYDGDASDLPFLDDVVGIEVGYYGEKRPPRAPRPALASANCLYELDGSFRSALLPAFEGPGASEVALTSEVLIDGPWCGTAANQFDADWLRLRRVRVTARLQASDPSVRGTDSRFRVPGHARHSAGQVSDVTVAIDVGLRNVPPAW
jgi:prepilin-type N-terminal cleavage/methylation domain-containing protein